MWKKSDPSQKFSNLVFHAQGRDELDKTLYLCDRTTRSRSPLPLLNAIQNATAIAHTGSGADCPCGNGESCSSIP